MLSKITVKRTQITFILLMSSISIIEVIGIHPPAVKIFIRHKLSPFHFSCPFPPCLKP